MWVSNGTKKRDWILEDARRGEGVTQGGVSIMCRMGASWHGVAKVASVARNERLTTQRYIAIMENRYAVQVTEIFGDRPFVFQQDGAAAHASKGSQKWRSKNYTASRQP